MTLDLGPGINVQPHTDQPVIRYDVRGDINATVVGDLQNLPFQDESFSTVYASHVLEHFPRRQSKALLKEWTRVLRWGGEFQLFVPNLEWSALQIMHGICDDFVLNALYGRHDYPGDAHHTGFTPSTLNGLLSDLPLRYDIKTFRNSICVWAKKV